MVGGHRQHERLDLQRAQRQVVAGHRGPEHPEVEAAVAQPTGLRRGEQVGVDLERDLGQVAGEGAGDPRELGEGRRAGEGDPEQAEPAVGDPADAAHAVVERPERAPGLADQELAGGREADLPRGAVEEPGAELGLELADRLGQGRLGDVQALRRSSEVPGLGHRGEAAQVSQLHVASVRSGVGESSVWSSSPPGRTTVRTPIENAQGRICVVLISHNDE